MTMVALLSTILLFSIGFSLLLVPLFPLSCLLWNYLNIFKLHCILAISFLAISLCVILMVISEITIYIRNFSFYLKLILYNFMKDVESLNHISPLTSSLPSFVL